VITNPVVAAPFSGQGWNPYSYVWGRPLAYVDPSGFEPLPPVDPEYAKNPEVQRITARLLCIGTTSPLTCNDL